MGTVSYVPYESRAVAKAISDVARGDDRMARTRLRSYIDHRPDSMVARRLLADSYRRDGYPDEAGRWGYLIPGGASEHERRLYERACSHRLNDELTATFMRKGLHWPRQVLAVDPSVNALLAKLDKRAAREKAIEGWLRRGIPVPRWLRVLILHRLRAG